jgi:cysteine desulfurase/selenocysteine lyase
MKMLFEPMEVRNHFPILNEKMNDFPLHYFDSAATSLKPKSVIDRINRYNSKTSVNIHRGIFKLSEDTTQEYEDARDLVQSFIKAPQRESIIFTKGTTEGINLIARSYGEAFLNDHDEILLTELEHHSNIVPWQILAQKKNLKLKYLPINENAELDLSQLDHLLNDKTKIVSLTGASNTLGTLTPLKDIIKKIREKCPAVVVIDAAQLIPHQQINVVDIDCDFLCFSGHKLFASTGVGVLYGKINLLEKMPPFLGGGDMIKTVSFTQTTYNDLPFKFEAGTPAIAEVISLGTAIEFISLLGDKNIHRYEFQLLQYLKKSLSSIEGLQIHSRAQSTTPLVSFTHKDFHTQDLTQYLDKKGIALRSGHMCTQPLLKKLEVSSIMRVSLGPYNLFSEIDYLTKELKNAIEFYRKYA